MEEGKWVGDFFDEHQVFIADSCQSLHKSVMSASDGSHLFFDY